MSAQAERPRGQRVYLNVYDEMLQRIRNGEWPAGQQLPSITQLARQLNAGTGSVREALRSLESVGVVRIMHGRGVFVTGLRPATELSSHFEDVGDGMIVALAETRRILEPELAALAAERGSDEQLAAIERLAQLTSAEAERGSDFAELDVQFHHQIALAAANPILYRTISGVSDLFLESRRRILMDPENMTRSSRYHLLIAEAIRVRNAPQARLLMQAHMNDMFGDVQAAELRAAELRATEVRARSNNQ
jgi:GntR family transcriptional repressor for pyruvate dehydrogenase complex